MVPLKQKEGATPRSEGGVGGIRRRCEMAALETRKSAKELYEGPLECAPYPDKGTRLQ